MKNLTFLIFFLALISISSSIPNPMSHLEHIQYHENILLSQNTKLMKYPFKGYGVAAEKPFKAGEPVLCVNISDRLLPYSEYELSHLTSGLTNLTALKVRVLFERYLGKKGNPISDFIFSLTDYVHHYGLWSRSQQSLLKNLTLIKFDEQTHLDLLENEEFNEIVKVFKQVKNAVPEMLEYKTFAWASFQVKSRYFWCDGGDQGVVDCMHPHLDLVNFEPITFFSRNQEFLLDKDGLRCFLAKKDLQPGDELTFDYVIHKSFTFFLDYDIVYENYAYDSLDLTYKGKVFQLYAFSVNEDLIQEIQTTENQDLKTALITYRQIFIKHFPQHGIRQTRRLNFDDDFISNKIKKYGISTRTTYYNHLARIDAKIASIYLKLDN